MIIGIIGAGAWGSTLAYILSEKVDKVYVWCRNQSFAEELNKTKENKKYLLDVHFKENVVFTSFPQLLEDCKHLFVAVPTIFLRNILKNFGNILGEKILYSSIKGMEAESLLFPSEIIKEEIPNIGKVVLLMGPSLSTEIVKKLPTTFVVSSPDAVKDDFDFLTHLFAGLPFRFYYNADYRGVEFGGIIKNVYAIAFGILNGLNLGFNAAGSLLSRALFEITKLSKLLNIKKETIYGISCLSDLVTSGFSSSGRNFTVGYMISQGKKLEQILKTMPHIPEGIYTLKAMKKIINDNSLDLPVTNTVYNILYNNLDVKEAIIKLLSRAPVEEFYT